MKRVSPANILAVGFIILGLAGLAVVYALARPGSHSQLTLDLPGGGKIQLLSSETLAVPKSAVAKLDPSHYFVDSTAGFAFKKPPVGDGWTSVSNTVGIPHDLVSAVACLTGTSERKVSASSNALIQGTWSIGQGRQFNLGINRRTTVEQGGLTGRASAHTCTIPERNLFEVEVFPKSTLRHLGIPVSLPGFYSVLTVRLLGIVLDKLVANEHSILGNYSAQFRNASLEGGGSDLDIYRAFLFTESPRNFYVVEIAYYPQSGEPIERWSDLQKLLQSFRVITP